MSNPLSQFFRSFKIYIRLPSGTAYYSPDIVEFTDQGEVGILPMTGKDELTLKNPDALLNGQAIIEVITSCVPAVKNPKKLLTNDIDAIITAIRFATFNDMLETELICPNCSHKNLFKINLQYSLDNMTELEPEYVINLDSGLSVFVKPYSFTELIDGLRAEFEQSKYSRALTDEHITEATRTEMVSKAFKEIAIIKFKLISNSIVKVVSEERNINVSDKTYIHEFLQNIENKDLNKINDLITEINKIGLEKSFTAKCEKCEHEWKAEIDFNPVNFS